MQTSRSRNRLVAPVLTAVSALLAMLLAALLLPGTAVASGPLRSHADAIGFDIGFALDPNRLNETAYRNIADAEFNFVVAENAMKWDATEPQQNQFQWSGADAVANYANSSSKGLYGHTLVWHSQLPGWVSNIGSGSELLAVMRNHISAVAGRYANQVVAWDVVNEAFNEDGSRRQSVFQQRIGNSYLAEAFLAARAAAPNAKLCINDYNTDGINSKSTAIYNLVSSFKQQGIPIDCVGFQAHLIVGQVPSSLQQNLQRFADLGVDVRITELDIRMALPADSGKLAQQANDYRSVVNACLAVSRCQGVTVWGITDRYSWVPDVFPGQGAALLWDDNYNAKPAYGAVHEALAGSPPPTTPPPTTPPPGSGCQVTYTVSSWNTGFTANLIITNTGGQTINGWTLAFAFSAGQTVVQPGWNAAYSQSGGQVTATNLGYNSSIPPDSAAYIGFNGAHNGSNPNPTAFTLNGVSCTVS